MMHTHSDLRAIAADARKLLMVEASLFLEESELGELGEERITPAMVRAVLEAAESFCAKKPPAEVVIAPPSHAPYIERSNGPVAAFGPEPMADAPPQTMALPSKGRATDAPPVGMIVTGAAPVPADWPAKLLAAGLENGEAYTVAQLEAQKEMWRNVRRDTQRRIVYAVIRHLGGGEHVTGKQYDEGRPPWLPSNVLLYQQFAEKWSETVAAALEGVAAPTGAPFHAATTLAGRGS